MSKYTLSIGIIGLPNVGKSTIFNLLLQKQAAFVAEYPFATIEPNVGVVPVPDERLKQLGEIIKNDHMSPSGQSKFPEKVIPTTIKFFDIAGLVKGAHKGEGLGNEFLSHIRGVDALLHVVRAFDDPQVAREGSVNPKQDTQIINTELILSDLMLLEKRLNKLKSDFRTKKSKEAEDEIAILERAQEILNQNLLLSNTQFNNDAINVLNKADLLTIKPMLYVINISEKDLNKDINQVVDFDCKDCLSVSAKIEFELTQIKEESEKTEFMEDFGVKENSLDSVIRKSYEMLDLITFFSPGPKEVRAWTVTKGTKAPQAGSVIHTDFEKGFISVDVVNFVDLKPLKSLKKAKEKGLVKLEGKNYVIKDGDVVNYNFSV